MGQMERCRLEQLFSDLQAKKEEIGEVEQALQNVQSFGLLLNEIKNQKSKAKFELRYLLLQAKEKEKAIQKIQPLENEARNEFSGLLDQLAEEKGQDSDTDAEQPPLTNVLGIEITDTLVLGWKMSHSSFVEVVFKTRSL